MLKKYYYFFACLFFATIFSCKKENSSTTTNTAVTNNTPVIDSYYVNVTVNNDSFYFTNGTANLDNDTFANQGIHLFINGDSVNQSQILYRVELQLAHYHGAGTYYENDTAFQNAYYFEYADSTIYCSNGSVTITDTTSNVKGYFDFKNFDSTARVKGTFVAKKEH